MIQRFSEYTCARRTLYFAKKKVPARACMFKNYCIICICMYFICSKYNSKRSKVYS